VVYEVPIYDGMNYEFTGKLNKVNADKLRKAL